MSFLAVTISQVLLVKQILPELDSGYSVCSTFRLHHSMSKAVSVFEQTYL